MADDDFRDFDLGDDDGFDDDFSFDDDFGDDDFGFDDAGGDDFDAPEPADIDIGGFGSFDDFEGEDQDVNLDENYLSDFDTVDDDFVFDEDEPVPEEERGGIRPAFLILGLILVLMVVGGIAFFIINQQNDTNRRLDITRTFIAEQNDMVAQTSTAAVIELTEEAIASQTAAAAQQLTLDAAATQTVEGAANATATAIAQAQIDADATATAIALEGDAESMTQTALAMDSFMTQTAIAALLTGTPEDLSEADQTATAIASANAGGPDLSEVQMTATALAQLLRTPTREVGPPITPGGGAFTPIPTIPGGGVGDDNNQLPNTGVFDDLAPGALLAIAFLLGISLIMARGGRIANRSA